MLRQNKVEAETNSLKKTLGNSASKLKKIKRNVELMNYENGEMLKKEIKDLHKATWQGIMEPFKEDLSEISKLHSFLIREVLKIHETEESQLNNNLMKENLNIKPIISKLEDGKLSSRIYCFNKSDVQYYFVGDIHSDDYIFECILERTDFFNEVVKHKKIKIIFLGDYVDRGKEHLKTMEKIMILKYIFPGNIFLLMGNHDGGNIKEDIVSLCVRKPESDKAEDYFMLYLDALTKSNSSYDRKLIEGYLNLFKSMAIISFVSCGSNIFCGVHGGIPRPLREEEDIYGYISSLSDLTNEEKVNIKDETIISNIIWSDPLEAEEDKYEHTRRFGFKESEFNTYAELIGIDYLIRGHEANEEGYRTFFKEKLYCIFASGQVKDGENELNLSTAYPWVKPKILKVGNNEGINIIDLYLK